MGDDLKPSTAWHAQFEDVNNDGRPDLFVAKGNVDRMPDFAQKDPNNLLLQKPDASFTEVGDVAGVANNFVNAASDCLKSVFGPSTNSNTNTTTDVALTSKENLEQREHTQNIKESEENHSQFVL